MNKTEIVKYLSKLAHAYDGLGGPSLTISICGGAALMVLGLVNRTTKDIDLVAPQSLPPEFYRAASIVAKEFGLPEDWINQGPKQLADMGLPDGFDERAIIRQYGKKLAARFASRLDQIFFKTYASADRGGYHAEDLKRLNPSHEELKAAALWCMSHDVSSNFRDILKSMLDKLGYEKVAQEI
ncbi:MAG: DUF6036 family nucleotidyltransferase [Pseudomonadota bacterium]